MILFRNLIDLKNLKQMNCLIFVIMVLMFEIVIGGKDEEHNKTIIPAETSIPSSSNTAIVGNQPGRISENVRNSWRRFFEQRANRIKNKEKEEKKEEGQSTNKSYKRSRSLNIELDDFDNVTNKKKNKSAE
ncbi:hypothetical protein Mgra_00006884 [Meloidogyne graminicola]|uniref:Uncharacterized protein n=1 Tax=Meloidogyne graminicola TaxID=189291 RepID=A0A8S9ZK99_9BILA|nr:hypothetical protein Mgra_00006884 [Meloidogyne graminicola]